VSSGYNAIDMPHDVVKYKSGNIPPINSTFRFDKGRFRIAEANLMELLKYRVPLEGEPLQLIMAANNGRWT